MANKNQRRGPREKRKRKSTFKNILFNLLLTVMLVVGLALVFNNQIKNIIVRWMGNDFKIENVTREDIQKNKNKDADFDFDAVVSLDLETVLQSTRYRDQLYVVGGIAIPSINLNLPIFRGVSNYTISAGAGTMKPDQEMGEGNYALASHEMSDNRTLFGPIKLLPQPEEEEVMMYLTDLDYLYEYKMTVNMVVPPTQSEVINDVKGKRMLTLVTCTISGYDRVIIQGELVKKVPVKDASAEAIKAFEMETLTLI